MRNQFIISLAAVCGLIVSVQGVVLADTTKKVEISASESSISWVGRKVTGSHAGTVPVKAGEVILNGGSIASGTFGIDLSGVKVTDIPDPKNNAKLVGHLKSPDFFAAEMFPTAQFTLEPISPE
jgi:polyisoprenoid-binding protein YceI